MGGRDAHFGGRGESIVLLWPRQDLSDISWTGGGRFVSGIQGCLVLRLKFEKNRVDGIQSYALDNFI